MKYLNKNFLIPLLIVPVAVFMISCCCLSQAAHASVSKFTKKQPPCHASSQDKTNQSNPKKCDCCSSAQWQIAHQASKNISVSFVEDNVFWVDGVVLQFPCTRLTIAHSGNDTAPPWSRVKIYLRDRNIRI